MRLSDLIATLGTCEVLGPADAEVTGIAYDSRRVQPGDLFVPWSGGRRFGDGHRFIPEAIDRGAAAVVAQRGADFDAAAVAARVPLVVVADSRRALAVLAARFYGEPSLKLRLIGVTGTNGKTTTTHLIRELLESDGRSTGLIGTIHYLIGQRRVPADRTTPQAPDIQALLAEMAADGCQAAVMEVASIALVQERVTGCEFDVAVFTNLTQDHLDDHGSMEAYAAAKRRLFEMLGDGPAGGPPRKTGPKYAVVNIDDPESARIQAACRVPVVTYAIDRPATWTAGDIRVDGAGTAFRLRWPGGECPARMPLMGRFNVYNAMAALAVASGEGVPLERAIERLGRVQPVAGRFERVDAGQPFPVIVDYAHTPDGLANVLETAREFTRGRLIVVFGCGGDRDPGKRPRMGEVAARAADYVILTSDNPRSEDPEAILAAIEEGIAGSEYARRPRERIVDRRAAIARAIELAQDDDVVIIAGKGHETYQIFRDRTIPFDDRVVAAEAIRARLDGRRS